jgi:hypothetical protein
MSEIVCSVCSKKLTMIEVTTLRGTTLGRWKVAEDAID